MAIIKCKMCGGDLTMVPGQSVAECEYCGTVQTVPSADNEKKLNLFARANRLRVACEFDKAAGIYESIVEDFLEEAEAYWGLVLCKYGIEYVDDPATGKKIPTCHRSSFDSILEDSDFEQALENSDAIARRVYREEAKQIEEIRKGIIAVSANEAPYDIFICYKETDEKGDRTLDSVLAQDLYDALTDKGYRVFFSRITLEDKLGQEYEPYIFAALNSAKIMLAVGTDYEYFNAVWVKNEWSRFLKLMEKDKNKHLIPCFKGIDAYDMPREFAKLQAQDLGKVGAVQDLLRGVEKLLPKKENNTIIIQNVSEGSNKIASILDRGYMALEDGDWDKADAFFEEVLNNDAKNAYAYLGKTLVQERCASLQALVEKRIEAGRKVDEKRITVKVDDSSVREAVDRHFRSGVLDLEYIKKQFIFDSTYYSMAAGHERRFREEQVYWSQHKLLSRAIQYAKPPLAEQLETAKEAVYNAMAKRIARDRELDAIEEIAVQVKYEQHLAETNVKLAQKVEAETRKNEIRKQLNKETGTKPNGLYTRSKKEKPEKWKRYEETRAKRKKYQESSGEGMAWLTILHIVNLISSILMLTSGDEYAQLIIVLWCGSSMIIVLFYLFGLGIAAGCVVPFILLAVLLFLMKLVGKQFWIIVVLMGLFSLAMLYGEVKAKSAQRKLSGCLGEEYILMRELVNDHKAYVAKIQEIYIPDLGSDEVNYAIKMVVDAYPDEDFKENLIDEIYPKIGYKRPENKEK